MSGSMGSNSKGRNNDGVNIFHGNLGQYKGKPIEKSQSIIDLNK